MYYCEFQAAQGCPVRPCLKIIQKKKKKKEFKLGLLLYHKIIFNLQLQKSNCKNQSTVINDFKLYYKSGDFFEHT